MACLRRKLEFCAKTLGQNQWLPLSDWESSSLHPCFHPRFWFVQNVPLQANRILSKRRRARVTSSRYVHPLTGFSQSQKCLSDDVNYVCSSYCRHLLCWCLFSLFFFPFLLHEAQNFEHDTVNKKIHMICKNDALFCFPVPGGCFLHDTDKYPLRMSRTMALALANVQ